MKNKKAAMEMSVGTIVTIVLLMTVLVLGLVMVKNIFSGSSKSIDQINEGVQSEINNLFSDGDTKLAIYPASREITLKKGDIGGFGLSIINKNDEASEFSYTVEVSEISSTCQMNEANAEKLIILGKSGDGITLESGSYMDNAVLVKFEIPETAPLCEVRYKVTIEEEGRSSDYAFDYVDLIIK